MTDISNMGTGCSKLSGLSPLQLLGTGVYIAAAVVLTLLQKNRFVDADLSRK